MRLFILRMPGPRDPIVSICREISRDHRAGAAEGFSHALAGGGSNAWDRAIANLPD